MEQQKGSLVMRNEEWVPDPPQYTFVGPFAYSLRCLLCRMEIEHTRDQHDILRSGVKVAEA
jgi:hypothetical protein